MQCLKLLPCEAECTGLSHEISLFQTQGRAAHHRLAWCPDPWFDPMRRRSFTASDSSPPSTVPMKRKRGRPRKREGRVQGRNKPVIPGSPNSEVQGDNKSVMPDSANGGVQGDDKPVMSGSANNLNSNQTTSPTDECDDKMLGKEVACVIEACFSGGYLVNVQVAADTFLRGVVFRPERVVPVTAENDVAPQVRMIERKDTPMPFVNPETQIHSPIPMPSEQINKTVDNFMQKLGLPETKTKTKLVIETSTKADTSNSKGGPSTGIANILDVGRAVPSKSKRFRSTY